MRRNGTRRQRLAWLAMGGGLATVGFLGCVDLFHSTDFSAGAGCAVDAGGAGCAVDTGGGDGANGKDARVDGRNGGGDGGHVGDGGARDGTVDHGGTGDGGGGVDASGDSPATITDGGLDAKLDTGTNFCAWSHSKAEEMAQRACLWLGACAGNTGLNEYGTCYPTALLAYDCTLNPNQQVRAGALHAYWDALSRASSCSDVMAAIFGGKAPACSNSVASCGNDLTDGGFADIVTTCGDGGFTSAVNCQMLGYTCSQGVCTNGGAACTGANAGCTGNVLHSCQNVENAAGTGAAVTDVGRDCTNFGAGKCVADASSGAYGCVPNNAGGACTPSGTVACAPTGGSAFVAGCATGNVETVQCSGFGPTTTCSPDGGAWMASSRDLAGGCYDPSAVGGQATCSPSKALVDVAGPSGVVEVGCLDAGFSACAINVVTGKPFCPP